MRRLTLLACLLAAALAPAASAPAALQTVVQDDAQLLHRPPDQVAASVARLQALGVDRVRISANWSVLTRDADSEARPAFDATDPAAYEQERWRGLDTAVRLARQAGLAVLVDVGFWAPRWATSDPGPRARTDIDPDEFARFAVAIARRYSGGYTPPTPPAAEQAPPPSEDERLLESALGEMPSPPAAPAPPVLVGRRAAAAQAADGGPLPAIDQLALWNEPNHQGFLLPQWHGTGRSAVPASPARYRAMVQAAYPAIKQVRPDVAVLIGNTSSTGGTPGTGPVAPLRFLRALACVDERLRPRADGDCAGFQAVPGDGWAHHPYPRNERPDKRSTGAKRDDVRLADLSRLASTLRRLAAAGRIAPGAQAIHLTEFGYETAKIPGRPRLSQATQARWLTWAEYLADEVPAVTTFAQFLLRDQPPAAQQVTRSQARPNGEYFTGLLTAEGADKIAARTFVAGLFAQRRGRTQVTLWGRLRLGPGARRLSIQRRVGRGMWRTLRTAPRPGRRATARFTVDGREAFRRTVRHRRGARYRLVHPAADGRRAVGIAVSAVPAPRRAGR